MSVRARNYFLVFLRKSGILISCSLMLLVGAWGLVSPWVKDGIEPVEDIPDAGFAWVDVCNPPPIFCVPGRFTAPAPVPAGYFILPSRLPPEETGS